VQVQINDRENNCPSISRVEGRMASQAWVAEKDNSTLEEETRDGCKGSER
jgi:hypothetical protein